MEIKSIQLNLPISLAELMSGDNFESDKVRNALLIYPYIKSGKISHGKASEILGIHKLDLIDIYGQFGLPYLEMSDSDFNDEINTVKSLVKEVA